MLAGRAAMAGVAIPEEFVQGWTGAPVITLRTLQRAFVGDLGFALAVAPKHDALRNDDQGPSR